MQPNLQEPVDRYKRALTVPQRLIALHPAQVGNPGNAAALSNAVLLTSISAFEGFVEDFTAAAMDLEGESWAAIARVVGGWTNPDLKVWGGYLGSHFGVDIATGFSIRATRGTPAGGWSAGMRDYDTARKMAEAWMNVRHCLTHGATTGVGAERWPAPTRAGSEPPSAVLKRNQQDHSKHHLAMPGVKGCAAIYAHAAERGAVLVAANSVSHRSPGTFRHSTLRDSNRSSTSRAPAVLPKEWTSLHETLATIYLKPFRSDRTKLRCGRGGLRGNVAAERGYTAGT